MRTLSRLRKEARVMSVRDLTREVVRAYEGNDLLTYASAIAFQVFFAAIPMLLFALGVLGGTDLEEVWTQDLAPKVRENVSDPAFAVINDTVKKVIGERQVFWLTAGAVIALWEMSGAARAIMGVFDRIYKSERKRSFWERYGVSLLLSLGGGLLLLGAVAVLQVLPRVVDGLVFDILRWPIAIALLLGSVAMLVRYAPADHQPVGWVSFGAVVVVVAWIGTSLVYTAYLTGFADYGSVFGALATVIITLTYLYFASAAFLTGAQVDAILRERVSGEANGGDDEERPAPTGEDNGTRRLVLPSEVGRASG